MQKIACCEWFTEFLHEALGSCVSWWWAELDGETDVTGTTYKYCNNSDMSCRGKKGLSNNHFALSCLGQNTGAPALGYNQESTRLHIKLHSVQLNFKLLRWFRCPLRLPELSSPFPLQLHIPSTTTSQTSCRSFSISPRYSQEYLTWLAKKQQKKRQKGGGWGAASLSASQLCRSQREVWAGAHQSRERFEVNVKSKWRS